MDYINAMRQQIYSLDLSDHEGLADSFLELINAYDLLSKEYVKSLVLFGQCDDSDSRIQEIRSWLDPKKLPDRTTPPCIRPNLSLVYSHYLFISQKGLENARILLNAICAYTLLSAEFATLRYQHGFAFSIRQEQEEFDLWINPATRPTDEKLNAEPTLLNATRMLLNALRSAIADGEKADYSGIIDYAETAILQEIRAMTNPFADMPASRMISLITSGSQDQARVTIDNANISLIMSKAPNDGQTEDRK